MYNGKVLESIAYMKGHSWFIYPVVATILIGGFFFVGFSPVFAAPRGSPYLPGDTLDPTDCSPGEVNCTVVTPPAGTGSAGSLTYWLATSTVSSTPILFWNNASSFLGIGTSQPSSTLHVVGVTTLQGFTFTNSTGTSLNLSTLLAVSASSTGITFTNATGTNLSATNLSSTRITAGTSIDTAKITATNVSSTNLTASTAIDTAKITATNVSSTNLTASTAIGTARITATSASSTNMTVGTYLLAPAFDLQGNAYTTSTIPGLLFTNATGTNINVSFTSSTGITFVNATGTNLSATNLSSTRITAGTSIDTAKITATNVSSTNMTVGTYLLAPAFDLQGNAYMTSTIPGLLFTNATGTNINVSFTSSTGITFVNATGSGNFQVGTGIFTTLASSTGITFTNATGSGNFRVGTGIFTTLASSTGITFTNATGSNAMTIFKLYVSSSSLNASGTTISATSTLIVCAISNCTIGGSASTTNTVAYFASTGGNVTDNSIVARGYISGGASDIGEYAPVIGDSSDYHAGDLLSVSAASPGKFEKSEKAYDPNLAGVVTETAGLVAGGGEDNHGSIVIALQGRLPVKVSGANGPIAVGDYLTSSAIPGYAEKATSAGRVIAIAMEAFNGATSADKGKILAFIEKSWYPGDNVVSLSSAPVGQSLQGGSTVEGATLNTYTFDPNTVYSFQHLTVGSAARPSGITIYDVQNKNPYCVISENGVLKEVPGECGTGLTAGLISTSTTGSAATLQPTANTTDSVSTTLPPNTTSTTSTTDVMSVPIDSANVIVVATTSVTAEVATDTPTASDLYPASDSSGSATGTDSVSLTTASSSGVSSDSGGL